MLLFCQKRQNRNRKIEKKSERSEEKLSKRWNVKKSASWYVPAWSGVVKVCLYPRFTFTIVQAFRIGEGIYLRGQTEDTQGKLWDGSRLPHRP